ncbi:5403_t:CDS:2 [Diversispora eburnea]|uniref:5403_t:CDS:1 n=1 Tax=Diversispora eburnea TaxID=1213867 RepID=A0A9N9FRD7_9GLOM|nr:5403_t:CDS:2 [Diversispora eburnea]
MVGPPKGYIEAIETRLHRMESLIGDLVHSNDPRAEALPSHHHLSELIASTHNFELLKRPELTELPSQELSDHLLEIYFTHVHPLLPVIYKPRFFDQLKDKDHLPHLLLNAIYSFSARFSDRPEVRKYSNDPNTAGDVFFDRAKALLDNDYDKARVTTIQALVILSLREYGKSNVTRAWLYAGMASRMSQELGMHRNNEKWHPIDLSREQREEQKRVFWAIPSSNLGRPLAIDEKDVDAAYPLEDDEEENDILPFKMEHVTVSSTSSPISSGGATTLCLHILYYSTLMLLHRPYISNPNSSNVCTKAATAIIEIADTMSKRKILLFCLNPVVYCVFTAAVIHTFNATQSNSSFSQSAKINILICWNH